MDSRGVAKVVMRKQDLLEVGGCRQLWGKPVERSGVVRKESKEGECEEGECR